MIPMPLLVSPCAFALLYAFLSAYQYMGEHMWNVDDGEYDLLKRHEERWFHDSHLLSEWLHATLLSLDRYLPVAREDALAVHGQLESSGDRFIYRCCETLQSF